jgi:T4-like virus tail tube protein gp19
MSMTKDLYDWINASWTGKAVGKDGAIIMADQNLVAVSKREFSRALITETSFPALDGASKDPAYFTLKFAPEYTRATKASGKITGPTKVDQKLWIASNFRLTIDGLDCTRVSRVGQFTVRQSVATDDIGDAREHLRVPPRLEFPNLTVTLAEGSAQSWLDWFDDFVINGNNDESKEKNGSMSLLSANRTDELMRIELLNLGIFSIGPDKAEANAEQIATVTAHLYCERMELHLGAKSDAGPAQVAKVKSQVKSTKVQRARAQGARRKVSRAK